MLVNIFEYSKTQLMASIILPTILKAIGQLVFILQAIFILVPLTLARLVLRFLKDHPIHFNPLKSAHPDIFKSESTWFVI